MKKMLSLVAVTLMLGTYQQAMAGAIDIFAPEIEIGIDFGDVLVGQSFSQVVDIKNTGATDVTDLSIDLGSGPVSFSGGVFPGTKGDCGTSLAAGKSCRIEATFAPTVAGELTGSMRIKFNDGTGIKEAVAPIEGAAEEPEVPVAK